MVALRHDAFDDDAVVRAAQADVERLSQGVPVALQSARPEDVRRAFRRCLEAEVAARRRREKVGDQPVVDEVAAELAVVAFDGVAAARADLRGAAAEGHRWVAIGNAWGVVALAGAGLLVRQGMSPVATPVYVAIAGAAAGPVAMFFLALTRRSFASMRVDRARQEWAAALDATDFATMGSLHAARIAIDAWRRRVQEAEVAEACASSAAEAWQALVGEGVTPLEGPLIAARLSALRAAQLRLLQAMLERRRNHAPVRRERPVLVDGAPSIGTWFGCW